MGNKKITIYKLIKLIKQNKAPKKVIYNGSEYKFCKDIGDYRRLGWEHCLIIKDVFTFDNHFHNSLYNMLNCKVEILSEENNEQHTKMQFPDTFEEFIKSYSFIDDKEIHTNGSELIPTFRLKQWEEHKKRRK